VIAMIYYLLPNERINIALFPIEEKEETGSFKDSIFEKTYLN